MLVRYIFKPNETLFEHFMLDLKNIMSGSVTTVNDLVYANTEASKVYGSYPVGLYNFENKSTYLAGSPATHSMVFSKLNNADRSEPKNYIRFEYTTPITYSQAVGITAISLSSEYYSANDYTGSSFTGVNGTSYINVSYVPFYIGINKLVDPSTMPIDIIVNKDLFAITQPKNENNDITAINDIGHTALTKLYTNSILMAVVYYTGSFPNPKVFVGKTYKFTNTAGGSSVYCDYGDLLTGSLSYQTPTKTFYSPNSAIATIENPVFWSSPETSYMTSVVYGWNKIPEGMYGNGAIYRDDNFNYRYVVDFANQAYSINIT